MIRDGIDIFKEYGITDTDPIAVFTNGPVKIGAETTKSLPIGVYPERTVRLGVTLENQWRGKIKKIEELVIEIPKSMEISHCENIEKPAPEENEDYRSYHFENLDILRYRDIKTFKSFFCILEVTDGESLLGTTPIATRYYRISTRYTYELESVTQVSVKEERGRKTELDNCDRICGDKDGCFCKSRCIQTEVEKGHNCNEDLEDPGRITDLRAEISESGDEITLTWTAPGDDGNQGFVTSYELKSFVSEIKTDEEWDGATPVGFDTTPNIGEISPAGFEMEGKMDIGEIKEDAAGMRVYFAIKAVDNVDNKGDVSNSPYITLPAEEE